MSIDKNEKKKLRIASKHHSKKHMAIMSALMNKGQSFQTAHRNTLKIERKA